jgi:D-aspartate ligase
MKPLQERNDLCPVILGGDWSTYSLAREFFEAFGVTSLCVAPGAVAVIEKSRFIRMERVASMGDDDVCAAVCAIAQRVPDKHVVLIANTDDRVETVERIRDVLPSNVVVMLPPHEVASMVSDKVRFQELCARYGLDTPRTEIVSLAGQDPISATTVPFPLIAKPAVSSEYAHLFAQGFQKVYFLHEQRELDELWDSLRAAGFGGTFLVQELISGDDSYMDSITMYVDTRGEVCLCAGAHVLLEDHVPALFGNPVAMITKAFPEEWEKLGHMLRDIGYHGFANIDLKRDPQTGRKCFMDFNPRIGANSYYVCAGGVNPMYVLVRDVVDGEEQELACVERNVLYTRIPPRLARSYLRDPELLALFDRVVDEGAVFNPTRCPEDTMPSRYFGMLMEMNYIRKFHRYYPEPTETSF